MVAAFASNLAAFRLQPRATCLWAMGLVACSAADSEWGLSAACVLMVFPATGWKTAQYAAAIPASIGAYLLGPISLVLIVPLTLTLVGFGGAGLRAALVLAGCHLLSHQFESLPVFPWLAVQLGSTASIVVPLVSVVLVFGPVIGRKAVFVSLAATLMALGSLELGAGTWLDHETLASGQLQILVIFGVLASIASSITLSPEKLPDLRPVLAMTAMGLALSMVIPTRHVSSIVFDEAHGKWATVQAPFGPDDFGRGVNYTYSSLFKYAERIVGRASVLSDESAQLPTAEAIFVLKMPVVPLSEPFGDKLEAWVRGGGRLLVVADHTDLYDTTQNLNAFLSPRFGLRLNSDAVYDRRGMPTAPTSPALASVFGRIDAYGRPVPWQTGTSLANMPITTVRLASFGPSYSEPGDYSRPNRFGPFLPRIGLRFADHISVAAFAADKGAIAVILDSTPWSNFSIFVREYRQIFKGIVHALQRPAALHVWGLGALFIALFAVAAAVWPSVFMFSAGGLAFGITLGAAASIGTGSRLPMVDGQDFSLRVILGPSARLEFLGQLVWPGERNFARIVSAMGKYNLDPQASAPGQEAPSLSQARKWLLIQPEAHQLPNARDILEHLRNGNDLTILLSPDQAADVGIRNWLSSLGLTARKTIGLGVSEDAKPGLLNRRMGHLLRDVRPISGAIPTSLLNERNVDVLMQSYSIRPTQFPRRSGLLNIAFSADQFSDDAVGEVWDGVHPSSLSRLRERQLASLILGEEFPNPLPSGLTSFSSFETKGAVLPSYLVLENGKTILTGKFDRDITVQNGSPSENPVAYLAALRDRTTAFIAARCPNSGRRTSCEARLLGPDMIEWMVAWTQNDLGELTAVELLHERRFSGLGATVNVVFGQ